MHVVKYKYEEYFSMLSDLWDGGWYKLRDDREELDWDDGTLRMNYDATNLQLPRQDMATRGVDRTCRSRHYTDPHAAKQEVKDKWSKGAHQLWRYKNGELDDGGSSHGI
jgi:hypothetical protein